MGDNTYQQVLAEFRADIFQRMSIIVAVCGVITGFVLDTVDQQLQEDIRSLNMHTLVTNTLMQSLDNRKQVASDVLDFIGKNL